MFNLLPNTLRDGIKKEYNLRKVILILLFIVFIQVTFMVFLMPTWLISKYKEVDLVNKGQALNSYLSSLDIASTTSNIKTINTKLSVIDKSLRYPGIVPFLNSIISKKTSAISITDVVYVATGEKNATVSVEGVSGTRESLLAFVKNLQSLGLFKTVDLPISNFTKDKNISFSINITIEQP